MDPIFYLIGFVWFCLSLAVIWHLCRHMRPVMHADTGVNIFLAVLAISLGGFVTSLLVVMCLYFESIKLAGALGAWSVLVSISASCYCVNARRPRS